MSRIGFHVDDGIILATKDCIDEVIKSLGAKWKMNSMDARIYTGWNIFRDREKRIIYVNQRDYIEKIKHEFGPTPQRSYLTPMDNNFDAAIDETRNA